MKRIIGLLMFLCCMYFVIAQGNYKDSVSILLAKPVDTTLINRLNSLNGKLIMSVGDLENGLKFQNEILKKAIVIKYLKGEAKANNLLGIICYYKSDLDSALYYYRRALDLNIKANYKKGIGAAHDNIAMILSAKGDLTEALKHRLQALSIQEEIKEYHGIVLSLAGVAETHEQLKNYNEAINYYLKALEVCKLHDLPSDEPDIYSRLGINYSLLKKDEQAVKCFNLSIKMYKQNHYTDGLMYTYNNLGNLFLMNENKQDSAIRYFTLAKNLIDSTGNLQVIATTCVNYGALLIKQKKYSEAEVYLRKALTLTKELGIKQGLIEVYGSLSFIAKEKKDFKTAYELLALQGAVKDSVINENIQNKISEVQVLYEREKKDKEIIILKKEAELKAAISAAENKRKSVVIWLGVLILILLSVFMMILVNRFRIIKKQKLQIEIQKKETERQKHIIEEKQKEILDSIRYAKRIQQSLLPTEHYMKKTLKRF